MQAESEDNGQRGLTQAKDILKTLSNTVKTFSVYPSNNPVYQKFATELYGRFTRFFEDNDCLSLAVGQHSLTYSQHEVYYSEARNANVSLILFVDGIRNISFHRGLGMKEITDFIDTLRIAPKEENPEDDLVTLLWERDFDHISYFVPDALGGALGGEEIEITEAVDDAVRRAARDGGSARAPGGTAAGRHPGCQGRRGAPMPSAAELAPLRAEARRLQGVPLVLGAAGAIFEAMRTQDSEDTLIALAESAGRTLDVLSHQGDVGGVTEVLKGLRRAHGRAGDAGVRFALGRAIARAGEPETVSRFFKDTTGVLEVKQYVSLLGAECVPGLVGLLKNTPHRRLRRLLCDALVPYAAAEHAPFAEALSDPDHFFVRTVLYVMGRSTNPAAIEHIGALALHEDRMVRMGVVRALSFMDDPRARTPLMQLLDDHDPVTRTNALRSLRKFGGEGLALYVADRVTGEDFLREPFSVKREFLEALGEACAEEAFALLSGLLGRWTFFRRAQNAELRAAAAHGLSHVRTPEAAALLEKYARCRNPRICAASATALRRHREGAACRG